MALIPHYFHYIQFNILVYKLKSHQVVFTITIAGVEYVYVKTVRPIASDQYSRVFSTAGFTITVVWLHRTMFPQKQ